MLVRVLLFVSIGLQFLAALLAISMFRRTKYNISWILFTIAFIIMALMLLFDAVAHEKLWSPIEINLLNKWLGIITAILLLAGVIFIRKIFDFLDRIERLRKENESRVLNAIIRTEEKERKQFAKDMHDGLGPLLSSIKMSLSSINDENFSSQDKRIFENSKLMIDESIRSLKEISNHLSPHILTNFGLVRALQNYAGKLNSLHSIKIDINSTIGGYRYNYNIEVVIYRVITELITNTLKHAGASQIIISIYNEEQALIVEYQDNGKGFDPDKTLNQLQGGMGYDNINTRLKSIMAQMELKSDYGEGVYVKIVVPMY
ncbi:MAG TPA: histidine kinase [Salinivirgaceae bacterium]|nr:histidine kinase [Salinivirgaceae bacterium]HQA75629.1 histidine kinase [Salinivirgaceae bacterium]